MKSKSVGTKSVVEHELLGLKSEILQGQYGSTGSMFLTTRQLAENRNISVVTAHKVLNELCASNYIELRGKRYYLTHGTIDDIKSRKLVGVLVPYMNNEFFSSLCDAVATSLSRKGYRPVFMSVFHSPEDEAKALQVLSELPIAGIINCVATPKENEHYYFESRIPSIMLSNALSREGISSVQVNSFSISQKVAQHLVDQGYTRFMYIGSKYRSLDNDIRYAGYKMMLLRRGYELSNADVFQLSSDAKYNNSTIARILKNASEPVGIFCYHDLIAMHIYNICAEIGKQIPDDVGLVGFDDLSVAKIRTTPLTSVQYRVATMAEMSVNLLVEKINNYDAPSDNYYVEPNLIIRKSSLLRG